MDSLILDLAVVLTFGVFLFLGFKKGIISSFFSFVSSVFSGVLSAYFSRHLSLWVYSNIIGPAIVRKAEKFMVGNSLNSENFLNHFPKFISKYLESSGITPFSLEHIMNNNAYGIVPEKISEIFEPIVTDVLRSVFVVVLFIVFMFVSKLLVRFVLGLFKSSLMRKTNTFLGGIFGLLKGYMVIAVALCCLRAVVCVSPNTLNVFSEDNISNTIIFKEIYNNNPIYEFFKFV